MYYMLNIADIHAASPERIAHILADKPLSREALSQESSLDNLSHTEKLQFFLSKFTLFRHHYLDELPDHILQLGETDYEHYKCRGTWWTLISGNTELAMERGLFKDPVIKQEALAFLDYIKSVQAHRRTQMNGGQIHRYTHEEINRANTFLDALIVHLSDAVKKIGADKAPPAIA